MTTPVFGTITRPARSHVLLVMCLACVAAGYLHLADAVPTSRASDAEHVVFTMLGHTGGRANALAVSDRVAFVNSGPRILAIDISDIQAPAEVGRSAPVASRISDAALLGHHLYVAGGRSGLVVLDVSDSRSPTMVARLAGLGNVTSVSVDGRRAYAVAQHSVLLVIDISDPTTPRLISEAPLPGFTWADDIVVTAAHAYVLGTVSWTQQVLLTVAVRGIAAPAIVATTELPTRLLDLAAWGNYVMLAGGGTTELLVYDVSVPRTPRAVAVVDTGSSPDLVDVDGDQILVATKEALVTLDTSRAPKMTVAEHAPMPVRAAALALHEGRAAILTVDYQVAAAAASTGETMDLGLPYDMPGPIGAVDVELLRDQLHIADNERLFSVVDIADPAAPTELGRVPDHSRGVTMALYGDTAFVTTDYTWIADDDFVEGSSDRVLQTGGRRIASVDVSDPTQPRLLNIWDTPDEPMDVAVMDRYLLVADTFALRIYDASDPATPSLVAAVHDLIASDVAVDTYRHIAYVGARPRGLASVGLSEPTQPRILSQVDVGPIVDAVTSGDIVFAALGGDGIAVVDAQNPSDLQLLATLDTAGYAQGLAVSGPILFVAIGSGIDAIDVSDPAKPTFVGGIGLPATVRGLAVAGELIYVAADSSGVFVLDWALQPGQAATQTPTPTRRSVATTAASPTVTVATPTSTSATPRFALHLPRVVSDS